MSDLGYNYHKPGSENWHKQNLGIEPDVVGIIDRFVFDDRGTRFITGWMFFEDQWLEMTNFTIDEEAEVLRSMDVKN